MFFFMFEFQINSFLSSQPGSEAKPGMTVADVALGFIRVANEAMCRPIRALTQVQFYSCFVLCPAVVITNST
jgi:hypothetical protein